MNRSMGLTTPSPRAGAGSSAFAAPDEHRSRAAASGVSPSLGGDSNAAGASAIKTAFVFSLLVQGAMAGGRASARNPAASVKSNLPPPGGPSGYSAPDLGLAGALIGEVPKAIWGILDPPYGELPAEKRTSCEVAGRIVSAAREAVGDGVLPLFEGFSTDAHVQAFGRPSESTPFAPALARIWCAVDSRDELVQRAESALAGNGNLVSVDKAARGNTEFDRFTRSGGPTIMRLPVLEALRDPQGADPAVNFFLPWDGLHALDESQGAFGTVLIAPGHAYYRGLTRAVDPVLDGYAEVREQLRSPD
jgi:hypothetical protein